MLVSLCVIALNEEETLQTLLNDIQNQTYPHRDMEIILVDSGSNDQTKLIMESFARMNTQFNNVQVLDNKRRIQATGWNIAIEASAGEAVIRVDAHARIPKDFVEMSVSTLEEGEDVAGGPRLSTVIERTKWQDTLLIAEESMFGSGIAPYRQKTKKEYVKSVFHGIYRKKVFEKAGVFNEKLGRTEDNELHYRIREAGYRIRYNSKILSYQLVRPTLLKMIKQKFANGYWIGMTTGVCHQCLSWYHYVPMLFVTALIITFAMMCVGYYCPFVLLVLTYFLAITLLAIFAAKKKQGNITSVSLPFVFFLIHTAYGVGTLCGFCMLPKFIKIYNRS